MFIIGIAGGTGSGKTTFVNKIVNDLPLAEVAIISQDAYYKDLKDRNQSEQLKTNFDHPNAIDFDLLVAHLKDLKEGKAIEQPVYSFISHSRTEDTTSIYPKKVLLVEGILIFSNPKLRDLLNVKIFLEVDPDERLIRRLKRDISERGRDMDEVLNRYQTTLKPMHEQFIETTKVFADIIVPNNSENIVGVKIVQDLIKSAVF